MAEKLRNEEAHLKDASFQLLQLQQNVSKLRQEMATAEVAINDREVRKRMSAEGRDHARIFGK